MKKVIVLLLFTVLFCTVNAQPNLLGKSIKEVQDAMVSMTHMYPTEFKPEPDKPVQLIYVDGYKTSMTYIFNNNKCTVYVVDYPINMLPLIVMQLNEANYIRVNDSTWCDKGLKFNGVITHYEKIEDPFFSLSFKPLK